MRKINNYAIRYIILICILISVNISGRSQSNIPEVLVNGSIREQLDYIQEKTRIYEDYRAIREDMFRLIRRNALDSLQSAKNEIVSLKNEIKTGASNIDSLNSEVSETRADLEKMTRTKNSIKLMGIQIDKIVYNTIMWSVIAILVILLSTGYLTFKRNRTVTMNTRKEIDELKKEFEAYKKASREAREKMSMAHFNELKRLRGA
jgi:predicted  nucleic acid-binding Zn-ribbon protein